MLKIAITGPESTGKSALCEALALHYKTNWVPEFARDYLKGKQPPYTESDLNTIADGQIESENKIAKKNGSVLFCDTEMTVMKIWSEHALGYCTPHIIDLYNKQHYDLYLLTDIDLNWEPDPLREHPHLREYFFDNYKKELTKTGRPFKIIRGIGDERLTNAVKTMTFFLEGQL
jgi:NadR type nicotinamide-nucleotide adenylyltransferase